MTPDALPEKAYLEQLVNDVIAYWEGQRNITTTAFNSNTMWDFGYATAFSQVDTTDNYWSVYMTGENIGIPPLRFWDLGNAGLCDDRVVNQAATDNCIAMWMQDYVVLALGRARELGYATDALLAWIAPNVISQITDATYNPFLGGAYRTPVLNSSAAHFTTWADVRAAYLATVKDETDFYPGTVDGPGTQAWPDGNVQPFASVISLVADQPGGMTAWDWVATNIEPSIQNELKWATLPRSLNTAAPSEPEPPEEPSQGTRMTGRVIIKGAK
jgi:hypothetical protein